MADLKQALKTIFQHEGRYPLTGGEMTTYGISLRFLLQTGALNKEVWLDGDINQDGRLTAEDIRVMKEADAARLYDLYYWAKQGYARINDEIIAAKVFDLAVNMSSIGANKCLQRAIRAAKNDIILDIDGIFNEKTLQATNAVNGATLLPALKAEAASYYRAIKVKGSDQFLEGWLNRAYSDPVL
jgi:lysozyme family protein